MKIVLNKITPAPLAGVISSSGVYEKSLDIPESAFVHLSAASGKGKTTLLHILYGTRRDYRGEVEFDKNSIKLFSINKWAELRRNHFSIVFQELKLFPTLSGLENILIKSNLTRTTDLNTILRMAEKLQISEILEKKCEKISLGEQQRIAIIRALVQPFDWILLDEPFSNLDPENIKNASSLILQECKKRNAGLIITALKEDEYFSYNLKLIM